MKIQYWLIPLGSILLGIVIGYGMTPGKSALPLTHADGLEQHMIDLDAKIVKVEEAVNLIAENIAFATSQSTNSVNNGNHQQELKAGDNRVDDKVAMPDKPMLAVNNSTSARISAEEQVAVNRLIQDIGDRNLDSHSVLGSENMQSMSLAAQNQVMAEITRRLNSGELRTEEFFGPDYPKY